jgi:hypothetical protein
MERGLVLLAVSLSLRAVEGLSRAAREEEKRRHNESSAFMIKCVLGSLFLPPLLTLVWALWTSPQTPILARMLWARARELAGRELPPEEIEEGIRSSAEGVRRRSHKGKSVEESSIKR